MALNNFDTSSEVSSSNHLSVEGTFHFIVTSIDENPTDKNGGLIANAAFKINADVLDGTAKDKGGKCTQIGKDVGIMLFLPKLSDKNQGAFAREKITKALLALNYITPEDLGKPVSPDFKTAVGRQFVARMSFEEDKDGKKNTDFIRLHFSDIWHVDAPESAEIPKSKQYLAALPAAFRRVGGVSASAPSEGQVAPAPAADTTPKNEPPATTPAVDDDDF